MGRASKRATKVRAAGEFSIARLAAELLQPRDGSVLNLSWSLADIVRARDEQMLGRFRFPSMLAASMRTDDALFVAYDNRLAPLRCLDVELRPASEKGKAISVAGEADALFGPAGVGIRPGALADIHGSLTDHGIGFGCVTARPRDDGSRVDFFLSHWPIEFVRWDPFLRCFMARVDPLTLPDSEPRQVELPGVGMAPVGNAAEVPIIHGDGRWVIFAAHEWEPFKKSAALMPASFVFARHAFAIRDWAKGSVTHGNAKVVGEMPLGMPLQSADGALTPEAQAFLTLLQAIASGDVPVGIRPAGSKTDYVTNTSLAWQVWSELAQNAEKAAARIYLGTDGTLGTQGGAPGVDITALFGVALTKIKADVDVIERALLTGLIEPWCAVNFGDSTLAPTRRYMLPDADREAFEAAHGERRAAFFADIAAQRANGFEVTQESVDALAERYEVDPPQLPVEATKAPTIALAPTDLARVISVNEARASAGLGPLLLGDGSEDPDGLLTVEQFGVKKAAVVAATIAPAAAPSPAPGAAA